MNKKIVETISEFSYKDISRCIKMILHNNFHLLRFNSFSKCANKTKLC